MAILPEVKVKTAKVSQKSGQAIVELAIFGSLIIVVFGSFLSYIQRANDQQYVQMEAFRRALERSETYKVGSANPGASVQFTLIQTRRHVDTSGSFNKRTAQTMSASSNVFWAVPESGESSKSLTVYRVNEDQKEELQADNQTFSTDSPTFASNTIFSETNTKQESSSGIRNQRTSDLQDTVTTTIPYTTTNSTSNATLASGTWWAPTQGVYYEGGQYKYSMAAVGTKVKRTKQWDTKF
jgi:hypothetical protein